MIALLPTFMLLASTTQMPVDPEHRIEPTATRDAYMDYCRNLGVKSDQLQIAEFIYEDYIEGLLEIQAASIERATAAGSDELDAVLQGRRSITPPELVDLRLRVLRTREVNWQLADNLLDNLVEGTEALGHSSANETVPSPAQDFRRRIILEHARGRSMDSGYAGEGLDFYLLVEEEKDTLLAGTEEDAIEEILQIWRERAARIVAMHAASTRNALLEERTASIRGDEEDAGRLMREHVARWQPLHGLNLWASEAVVFLLKDPGTAAAWRDRFRREQFPWLHEQDSTELLGLWILKHGQANQQAQASTILESYVQERDDVRHRAEELLLSTRLEDGIVLGSRLAELDPAAAEARRQWLRRSGVLESLKERTGGRLEAFLTPGQRAAAWRSIRER